MTEIVVTDTDNGARRGESWSWDWDRSGSCTAAMLIEERIRAEFDRLRAGRQASFFLHALAGPEAERVADRLVGRALDDFARGRLLLIVDDRQLSGLDARIELDRPLDAIFLRLTPLKGG